MPNRPFILAFAFLLAAGCGSRDDAQVAQDETQDETQDEEYASEELASEELETPPPQAEPAEEPRKEDPSLHRPAHITLEIAGREEYAGTYHGAGTSRTCGQQRAWTGEPSDRFAVEFPYEGDFDVVNLSFQVDSLRPGESTDTFHMDVSLRNAKGGRPPSFVVRAGPDRAEESGTASLVRNRDTDELTASGRNSLGTFSLTVLCQPREESPQRQP